MKYISLVSHVAEELVTGEPDDGRTCRYFWGEVAVTFIVISSSLVNSPKIGADLSLNMNELAK